MENNSQIIFTLFYAIYFAAIVGLTGPLLPFDTPSMYVCQGRAWFRFLISFLLLNIVPAAYFYLIFDLLNALKGKEITFPIILVVLLLSLGGFAFYRIYWGCMLFQRNGKYVFYGNTRLPKNFEEKIDSHPSKEVAGKPWPNIFSGLLWICLTLLIGWIFIKYI